MTISDIIQEEKPIDLGISGRYLVSITEVPADSEGVFGPNSVYCQVNIYKKNWRKSKPPRFVRGFQVVRGDDYNDFLFELNLGLMKYIG
ncbi:MAG: hypothetical protein AABX93_02680 [Nanoarchaeota archaeon]